MNCSSGGSRQRRRGQASLMGSRGGARSLGNADEVSFAELAIMATTEAFEQESYIEMLFSASQVWTITGMDHHRFKPRDLNHQILSPRPLLHVIFIPLHSPQPPTSSVQPPTPQEKLQDLQEAVGRGDIYSTRLSIDNPTLRSWMALREGEEAHHDVFITLSQVRSAQV